MKRPAVPASAASAKPWVTDWALKAAWWNTIGVRYSTPPAPNEATSRTRATWRSAAGNWPSQPDCGGLAVPGGLAERKGRKRAVS